MSDKNYKYKYSLLTLQEDEIVAAPTFESDEEDLNLYPYSDRCPIVVGSNQMIVNHEDDPIYEATCTFCGHYGVCKEYFKIDFDEDIMLAIGENLRPIDRYGNTFCVNTCYKKIDRLMHTKHGNF